MNQQLADDLTFSHSLLSFLFGGFQGSYAAMKIRGRLIPEKFSEESLKSCDKILTRTFTLLNDVYSGTPAISRSWKELETFEAATAFDDLDRLKKELYAAINELIPICIKAKTQPARITPEEVKLLVIEYGRLLYSRDYYLRCQVQYAQLFQFKETFEEAFPSSNQAQAELAEFNSTLGTFEGSALPPRQIVENLLAITEDLPIIFSVQAHEVLLLQNLYTTPLTYESLEITEEDARSWAAINVSPEDAAYWKAHLITPDVAGNWIKLQVTDPSAAYQWEKNGFNTTNVEEWAKEGFYPDIAGTWKRAGFTPQATLENIKKGIQDPRQAKNTPEEKKGAPSAQLAARGLRLNTGKKPASLPNKLTFKSK